MKELTPKEAIKELSYDNTAYGGKCTKEVREVAIKALEKQMPKKPVYKESTDKHEDGCWTCPVCGGTVGVYDLRDNWCSDCGTMIDWSE